MRLPSLTNRIFLAVALLVVLAIGFTAAFVSARVTSQAEAEIQRGLVESGAVVARQSEALVETFTLLARLTADLPKLKAAVVTKDPPTVQPLAAEYQQMLARSSLVVVTDETGRLLGWAGPAEAGTPPPVLPSVPGALQGHPASSFRAHPEGLLQVLSVPITVGAEPASLAGTLSVGFVLDRVQALDFKQLTGSEIAFGLDGRIRASTLPARMWPTIEQARRTGRLSTVSFAGDEYLLLSTGLASMRTADPARASLPAPDNGPFVVVVRSKTEQLRFLGPIQNVIGVTVIVSMLLAVLLSYAVARTVTRPLAAIVDVMREVAATGDLTRKIPPQSGRWEDEDARLLASTFNTLTDSIARFERDVTQRERLSSLGRLSSVVAHEIRNPLMIIKSALRTLRRAEADAAAVQEALQDIEQEVVRLNRIVSEVLDYAKPITFAWQPADPNAVCREAAQAAQVSEPTVGIALALEPGLAPIVTDADRVRTVLVNLLANAGQAVREARDAASAEPPLDHDHSGIELSTAARADGGVRIVVRDQGGGIDPALVGRIFEPYFTTRRAGTGLGLAIARNIVEGLGGAIEVLSDGHSGTEMCVDLPAQPRQA